jgi:hypothetical protein
VPTRWDLRIQRDGLLERADVSPILSRVEVGPEVVEISTLRRGRGIAGYHGLHVDDVLAVRLAGVVVPVVYTTRHHGLAADGDDFSVIPAGGEGGYLEDDS